MGKEFSQSYVLRTTTRHMRKDIDISIRKTFDRLPEFVNDEEKSKEIFSTLGMLHSMRRALDEFQLVNKEMFKDDKNEH
jgi:hypothetical protein